MHIAVLDMDDLRNPHWAGGQARSTREVFRQLATRHTITVYSSKYPGYEDYMIEGLRYQHIGLASKWSQINNLAYIASLPFVVPRLKVDVIMEDFVAPFATCFTPLYTKIPVVARASFYYSDKLSGKYKLPFDKVSNWGLRFYNQVIVQSDYIAKQLTAANPKLGITVIPHGVEERLLTLETSEKEYVLFLGRIDIYSKGLDLLLRAWQLIKIPGLQLIIAGSGSLQDEASLKELIAELGLQDRVTWVGKVHGAQKEDLLRQAKAVVYPSRFETFGISAIEALGVGKALVCFDIPGFDWLSPDVCIKVKTQTPIALSRALKHILTTKRTRTLLAKKGTLFAQKYNWQQISLEYERLLEQVAAREPVYALN